MVKGIIETVESKYEYKVRIPVYHRIENTPGAIPTEELPIAPVCTTPGVSPFYKKGDIVWIEFENDEIGHPVITGLLYREDMGDSTSDIKADSIDVNVDANLPTSTQIGVVGEQSLQSLSNITQTISNIINIGFVYRGKLDENDNLDNIELLEGWYSVFGTTPQNAPDGNWSWSKVYIFKQYGAWHEYIVKTVGEVENGVSAGTAVAIREYSGNPPRWTAWKTFSPDERKALEVHRGLLLPKSNDTAGYQHIIHIENTSVTGYYQNAPIIFRVMERNYTQYDIVIAFNNVSTGLLTVKTFYCKGLNPKDCVAVINGASRKCDIYVQKAEASSVMSITDVWSNAYTKMDNLSITYPNTYYGATSPSGTHAILINDLSENNGLLVQNDTATWIGTKNTATNNTIQIGVNAYGTGGLYDRTHESYLVQVTSAGSVTYKSGTVNGTPIISGGAYLRTNVAKGTTPDNWRYGSVIFTDSSLGTSISNRMGLLEVQTESNGNNRMVIGPYVNAAGSSTAKLSHFVTDKDGNATEWFPGTGYFTGNVVASKSVNGSVFVRAHNTSASGSVELLTDSAGNKGIYDRTNTKWMFHKSSDGAMYADQALNVQGVVNVPSGQSVVLQGHYGVNKGTIPVNASGTKVNQTRDIRILTADNLHGARFTGEITSGGYSRAYIMAYAHNSSSTISGRSTQFFVNQPSDGGAGSAYLYSNGDGASRLMAHAGNIHQMFPVGSVLCMNTNSAPALGGTWTLIDKEFKSQYVNKSSSIALNTTNTSAANCYCMYSGHSIEITFSHTTKVNLGKDDATYTIATLTPANFGVSRFGDIGRRFTNFSDGSSILLSYDLTTAGVLSVVEAWTMSANPTMSTSTTAGISAFTFTVSMTYTEMANDYCDKFYFKRTA